MYLTAAYYMGTLRSLLSRYLTRVILKINLGENSHYYCFYLKQTF